MDLRLELFVARKYWPPVMEAICCRVGSSMSTGTICIWIVPPGSRKG